MIECKLLLLAFEGPSLKLWDKEGVDSCTLRDILAWEVDLIWHPVWESGLWPAQLPTAQAIRMAKMTRRQIWRPGLNAGNASLCLGWRTLAKLLVL